MHSPAYDFTETVLTLRVPVSGLPSPTAEGIRRWLTEHGVNPDKVAIVRPIERDPYRGVLSWYEAGDGGGGACRRRITFMPSPAHSWPAPFPLMTDVDEKIARLQFLLDQRAARKAAEFVASSDVPEVTAYAAIEGTAAVQQVG